MTMIETKVENDSDLMCHNTRDQVCIKLQYAALQCIVLELNYKNLGILFAAFRSRTLPRSEL